MWVGVGVGLGGGECGGLIGVDRKEEFGVFFFVYLDDDFGFGGDEFGCVEGRLCCIDD